MHIRTFLTIALCGIVLVLPTPSYVYAESTTPDTTQTTVDTVKEAITNLVSAKDEKKQTETLARIDTLKKAVQLAINEAKDLRVKLIDLEHLSKEYEIWRTKKVDDIKKMIDTLESFKKEVGTLEETSDATDSDIKKLGEKIKEWRETTYLPISNEIQDYLLVSEEYKTIETAQNRSKKIEADIIKLEKKKKNIATLKKLLGDANKEISDAKKINDEAHTLFERTYIIEEKALRNDASSTPIKIEKETDTNIASTTEVENKEADTTKTKPISVKDLVEDSSNNINNAYKIFLKMSVMVRGLLK